MATRFKGYYTRNKIKVISTFVITLILITITTMVAMGAGSPNATINYKGDSWTTDVDINSTFNKSWYLNSADADTVNFSVDLTQHYDKYMADNGNTPPTLDPSDITVQFKAGDSSITLENGNPSITMDSSGKAVYNVTADLLGKLAQDGVVTVTVSFNNWLQGTVPTEFSVIRDTIAPSIEEKTYYTNSDSITIPVINCADGDKANGEIISGNSITFTGLVDGENVKSVTFDDAAGNTGTNNITVIADNTAPVISITGAEDNSFNADNKTVEVKVTETNYSSNNVTLNVTKTLDGTTVPYDMGTWANTAKDSTLTHEFTEEGTYVIKVDSTDASGRSASKTLTFTIDKTAPTVSITGADNNSFNKDNKTVEVKVTESNFSNNNVTVNVTKTLDGKTDSYDMGTWANTAKDSTLAHEFTEEGTYEVKVDSTDASGRTASQTLTFTIDKTAPVVGITGAEDNSFNADNKTVEVKVTESNFANNNVTINVAKTLDGTTDVYDMGTWANTAKDSTLTHEFTEEGTYTVTVSSTDAAGLTAETKTLTFTIDKTAPVVSITGAEDNSFNKDNKTVEVKVTESNFANNNVTVNVTKTLDGKTDTYDMGTWANTAKDSTLTHEFTEEGTYVVKVDSTDASGRTDSQTLTFTIDKTAPVVSITGADNNSFNADDKTVEVKVTESNFENNNVTVNVTKTLDGTTDVYDIGTWTNTAKDSTLAYKFTEDGTYAVTVSSTDAAGRAAETKTLTFTVDKTAPVVSITGAENNSFNADNKTVEVKVTESNFENNNVTVSATKTLDGTIAAYDMGTWANTAKDSTLTHEFKEEGTYAVTVNSTDASGRTASQTLTFTIDKTAPVVSITGADDNSFNADNKTVEVKVTESNFANNNVTINVAKTLDGKTDVYDMGTWANTAKDSTLTHEFKEEGTYVVTVNSTDAAGRSASQTLTFTIDKTAPVIGITGAGDNSFNKDNKTVEVKVTESNFENNNVTVNVAKTLDGTTDVYDMGTWANTAKDSTLTHEFTEEGTYVVKVDSTDASGRTASQTLTFTIDKTAPVVNITGADNNSFNAEDKTVEVKVTESNFANNNVTVSVTRTLDGTTGSYNMGTWANTAKDSTLTHKFDKDGTYVVTVSAADAAGLAADTKTLTFTVDKTAPVVSITGAADNSFNADNKTLQVKVTESNYTDNNVTINVTKTLDGKTDVYDMGTWTNAAKDSTLTHEFKEEGTYVIKVDSTDGVGNKADTKTLTFTIDKTAPVVSITGADNNSFNKDNKTVEVNITESNFLNNNVTVNVTKTLDGKTDSYDMGTWANTAKASTLTHEFTKEGTYVIKVDSTDAAGRTASQTLTFTIDKTAPAVSITGADNNSFNADDKTVEVKVAESNFGNNNVTINVTKTLDGKTDVYDMGTWANTAKDSTIAHKFTKDGTYTVTVSSTDAAGLTAETKTLTFTIDKTAPVVSITGADNNSFNADNKTVEVKVTESNFTNNNVTVNVTKALDGKTDSYDMGTWTNTAKDSTLIHEFTKEGTYVVTVDSTDASGRTASQTLTFTIDKTAPVISITGADNNSFNAEDKTVEVKVTESNFENNNVTVSVTKTLDGTTDVYDMGTWANTAKDSTLAHKFTEDGTYAVTVSSKDASGRAAETKTLTFTVDKTAPAVSITGADNNSFNAEDKTVEVKVTESNFANNNVTVRVTKTLDGKTDSYNMGTWANKAKDSTLDHKFKEEGTYVIKVDSTDASGRAASQTLTFTIDKTAPVISITGADNNSFNADDKTVEVKVTESNFENNNVTINVTRTLDGKTDTYDMGTWANKAKASTLTHRFNMDGTYVVTVRAADAAGRAAEVKSLTFTVDKTKPVISFTGVDNNSYNKPSKEVAVVVTESNYGNNTVDISVTKTTLDGKTVPFNMGTWKNSAKISSLPFNFSEDATYVINVKSTDMAGNIADPQTFTFTIDSKPPVITPKFKGDSRVIKNGEYINKAFTPEFALDRPDVDSIVSVTLNDGGNIKNNIPVSSTDMVYSYKVVARDYAGNEAALDITYTLDLTAPRLDITDIVNGFFRDDLAPKIDYSDLYLDPEKTVLTLNNEPFVSGTKLSTEKDYKLFASVSDLAGNTTARTIIFTLDKTQPVIKFENNINGKYLKENIIPKFVIDDMTDYEIVSMTLDGKDYDAKTEITQEGKHVLFLEVKDKAGNKSSLSVEFILDKTNPKVIYTGAENNGKYYSAVELNVKLDNLNDKITGIKVNGEPFTGTVNADGSFTITESAINKYKVEVTAIDDAQNETTDIFNFEIAEKSAFVKLYENKPLLFGSSGILIIGIIIAIFFFLNKKKHSHGEENLNQ